MSSFDSDADDPAQYTEALKNYLEGFGGQAQLAVQEIADTAQRQATWDAQVLAMRVLSDKVLRSVAEALSHIADQCADYDDPVIDDAGDDLWAIKELIYLVMQSLGVAETRTDVSQSELVAQPEVRLRKEAALRRLLDRGGENQ
ncbi:hypothetical protein ADL22_12735 [Streptomyces sp. NRRL F-4489]|uniref:hypothetical protein n=1 Tax=Streptomyces sp. NRRL F-4489 TaxID=1609095 RepID=UPI000746A80C|nr:hypothetical protein [Streptomyces sp. NRRL F-4489]KUL44803.1 hypothetical protein ADL22_12735 [Streptomyces sp. NRRL F-4489]